MSSSRGRPAKSREQPANSHRCVHPLASSRKAPTGWRRLRCQDCHYSHTLDTYLVRSTVKFLDLAPHQLACALQYGDRCSDYRSYTLRQRKSTTELMVLLAKQYRGGDYENVTESSGAVSFILAIVCARCDQRYSDRPIGRTIRD